MTSSPTPHTKAPEGAGYPDDVVKAAEAAAADYLHNRGQRLADVIAAAVTAERTRCLEECDYVSANIRCGKTERKRFDIWDLNQTFKGAVKCVRERIEGDWEKNWKPDPDAEPKAEG